MTREQEAELLEEVGRKGAPTHPILVRPLGDGGYQIVDGEHNWAAAKEVGLTEVPCEISDVDDFEAMRLTYVRNRHGNRDRLRTGRLVRSMLALRGSLQDFTEKSRRKLAPLINASEGTLRNDLLFAEAADVRKRYAPETADETIGKLSVARVRRYVELPGDRRDEWLDRGGNLEEANKILQEAGKKAKGPKGPKGPVGAGKPTTAGRQGESAKAPASQPEGRADSVDPGDDQDGQGGKQCGPAVDGAAAAANSGSHEPAPSATAEQVREPAAPLSKEEQDVVDGVLLAFKGARAPVRHKILAGLAADPDAVSFFGLMIKGGT
jgi:ParB-like chromosome segregation protein Spo0J